MDNKKRNKKIRPSAPSGTRAPLRHLVVASVLLLAGCESELVYNPGQQHPLLVMNALLEAGEGKDNYVYLHQSDGYQLGAVPDDACLILYVDDVPVETPQALDWSETVPYNPDEWMNEEQYAYYMRHQRYKKFPLKTVLRPGNRIRIEASASAGTMHAVARATVPAPPRLTGVDTCTVTQGGTAEPQRRYLVGLTDVPGEKNYYRLSICNDFLVRFRLREYRTDSTGNMVCTERDSLATRSENYLVNREDVILTDGHVNHTDQDEDNTMFPRLENKYNIFTDNLFQGSSATLKVYTPRYEDNWAEPDIPGPHATYCTQTIRVSLYALDEACYRYLQVLNCLEDDDYDTALMEPVSIPGNVDGGLGLVSVMTAGEVDFVFPERLYYVSGGYCATGQKMRIVPDRGR